MEDWEKNLWLAVEALTTAVEAWVEDVEGALGEVVETIEAELDTELQWFWQEWSTFWEDLSDFDGDLTDLGEFGDRQGREGRNNRTDDRGYSSLVPWSSLDGDFGLNPHLPANANHQPACQGCQHYHGYVYNGQLLVCAMHPYGWETEQCPDWQGPNPN
ncbi:hypothetical protein NON20_22495 [Synechocystis sp. B12]|nr:hypothetical protein NON20_22495 [Synechocystis sp. B12]